MEKLKKAYEAIQMLESLGFIVSTEQYNAVKEMEREYLNEEILPLIQQELEPLVCEMQNPFNVILSYSREDGLSMRMTNHPADVKAESSRPQQSSGFRKKKYIIRVWFPDGSQSCNKMVADTFIDVVRYAGVENVRQLGIILMGDNLVSNCLNTNERYRASQREVKPGVYVCTYSDTDTKFKHILEINQRLHLNLRLEKVYDW